MRLSSFRTSITLALLCSFPLACARVGTSVHGRQVAPNGAASGAAFLAGLVRAWPAPGARWSLAVTGEGSERVSSYDNALLVLHFLRTQRRAEAARVLGALAALQREDGALPFSFAWPTPEPDAVYVRSGALAWVGYAASEYLNAESGGPERAEVLHLAHGVARYLLAHQVLDPSDARAGLVPGGEGSFRVEVERGRVREVYVPGPVQWTASEHNIDAFFFLRDFAELTGDARFGEAAQRIRAALIERAWSPAAGQLARGLDHSGADQAFALDCASWGALFLLAASDRVRAETAFGVADARYRATDARTSAAGHRPYAHAPLIENRALAALMGGALEHAAWDSVQGIWPEGSAGVALAALRLGQRERAEQILNGLEAVRAAHGGLPDFTFAVPFEFDTRASLAGTVWVELVRYELARPADQPTLWRPE